MTNTGPTDSRVHHWDDILQNVRRKLDASAGEKIALEPYEVVALLAKISLLESAERSR